MIDFITISPPPGFKSHGVDLDSAGRWIDGTLIRWKNQSMRPVGGWQTWDIQASGGSTSVELPVGHAIPRRSHGWFNNNESPYIAVSTADAIYVAAVDGTVTEVTPATLVVGNSTSTENLSYGGKLYGRSTYGTPRTSDGVAVQATVWSLDNWGEDLVALSEADTSLWYWDSSAGGDATLVTDAPKGKAMLVTQERIVMVLGADGNPRLVQWSDQEDYTVWTPLSTNQAGDFELSTDGSIERAVTVRSRTLIVTTSDAHVAVYQGPPLVYGFQRVGVGCGIAAPMTLVATDAEAYWMGSEGFFMYNGSVVRELPCDVLDLVFDQINRAEIRMAWGVSNQRHSEVWWFYPSSGSLTCDRYVAYNYRENHWLIGSLERSCGIDVSIFNRPVWLNEAGEFYFHESGDSHGGTQPFAESGPVMIGNGYNVMKATQMVTDEKTVGEVNIAFDTRFQPDVEGFSYGPYELSNPPVDVRFTGRQIRMRVTGDADADFRLGPVRLRTQIGGRR
jgi:hypothetical protein